MESQVNFSVQKADIFSALKQLQKLEKTAKKKRSTLEVTIIDDYLQLTIPGIQLKINAVTTGSAKFTIPLWYFTDIVKTETDQELHFKLFDNQLKLRDFIFVAQTTFFLTDRILRSINLPVNFTQYDLAKLYFSGKYTKEEILFNNLYDSIFGAINTLEKDIKRIALLMKQFGFTKEEVKEILMNKLNGDDGI